MQVVNDFTTPLSPSPEYVRRSANGGLELVRTGNGIETTAPVQTTAKRERAGRRDERLVIGLEAAPILWTIQRRVQDTARVLEVF